MGHVQNCMASVFSKKAGETSISSRKNEGNAYRWLWAICIEAVVDMEVGRRKMVVKC